MPRKTTEITTFELDFSNTNIPEAKEEEEDEKEEQNEVRKKSVSFGGSGKIPEVDDSDLLSNLNTIRNSLRHSSIGKQRVEFYSNGNSDNEEEEEDYVEIVANVKTED